MISSGIFKTNSSDYHTAIRQLYAEAFGKGFSQQHIDNRELNNYIERILEMGYALIYSENDRISGILLACPLEMDEYLPKEISDKYAPRNCLYIAEMMVEESSRGKGLGKKLMEAFETTADKKRYTDAFIRVWDQNEPALSLYRKMGYADIAEIQQTKQKADSEDTFVMNKIYLHKKLI
jgi:GNAT superfamily N-acetyltransferase